MACGSVEVLFKQSAHHWGESHAKKAFLSSNRADISGTPLYYDASCLDVIVPGVLRIPVEVIAMNVDLRDVILDVAADLPEP